MKRDDHTAENSPYTVDTKNKYSSLEDEVSEEDLEEVDETDISDDSIVLTKRLNKLKRKSRKRKANSKSSDSSSLNSPESSGNTQESDGGISSADGSKVVEAEDDQLEVNCAALEPSPLMTIDIMIGENKVTALLDTGASSNMIQQSVVGRLKQPLTNDARIISGLGNKEFSTLGITTFDFSMYGLNISSIPFHVVEDSVMRVPIILGRTFCAKARLVLDMGR